MADNKIEAVLFDLGDTIINYGPVKIFSLYSQCADRTYRYLKDHSQPSGPYWYYYLRNLLYLKWNLLVSHFSGNDFDSLEMLKGVTKRKGVKLTDEQYEEFHWLWYEYLAEICWIEEDVKQTFEKLKGMGLKLGIVSNTFVNGHALDKHLRELGLIDFFDIRLYSCDFEYRKPDKRLFFDAAKEIGVEPANILFIGDKLHTDVKGSIASGMVPVLRKAHSNEGKRVPQGVHVVNVLADLPGLVEKLNG